MSQVIIDFILKELDVRIRILEYGIDFILKELDVRIRILEYGADVNNNHDYRTLLARKNELERLKSFIEAHIITYERGETKSG